MDNSIIYYHFKWNFYYRKSYNFRDALYSTIKQLYYESKDNLDIFNIIDTRIHIIRGKVNKDIDYYNRFKSYLRYYWSEDDPEILIGSAYILPSDSDIIKDKKRKLGNAFLLERILTNLDPYKYEDLCKKILKELGCQFIGRTRTRGDGGIDFFGTIKISEIKDNPLLEKYNIIPQSKIHFIGQAKRYKHFNVIHPEHIREFLGSVLLLEFTQGWNLQKELDIENVPPKHIYPKDPKICLFFTTSFATENAKKLANNLGILLQDGEDITRWIALNPLSDCEANEEILINELNNWIDM